MIHTEPEPVYRPRGYYVLPIVARCLRDVIHDLNYNRSNAIKYIYRAGKKSSETEIEDLTKAIECLTDELKRLSE